MDRYPDDRISEDGTVEPDQEDNTPPGVGPRTVDAGGEGQTGAPRVPTDAPRNQGSPE
jgi:hypothetical protein